MSRFTSILSVNSVSLQSAIVLGALLVASGCRPPTQQDVAGQYADLVKNIADRLDRVQSREEAEAAAADVQKLLTASDRIVAAARQTDAKEKAAPEVKQMVEQQLNRLKAATERLRAASLMTDALASAMEQLGLSSQAIAAAASIGKLPSPQSQLEEAWVAVLATYEEQANLLGTITSAAAADGAVPQFVEIERKRHAALTQVAKLGGEKPPHGVPEKYKPHYDAAQALLNAKDAAATTLLGQEATKRLATSIQETVAGDPALADDPFRVPLGLRLAATRTTIKLVNNRSLAGERHKQMVARLKQLAGATESQAMVEKDGSYKLVLAPVGDFDRFIKSIDFGDVSERNDQEFTFTLSIDPARFVAEPTGSAAAAPVGAPAVGGPLGSLAAAMEQEKSQFMARVGGRHKCITVILVRAPESSTPEYEALLAALRRISGATSIASFSVNGQEQVLMGPVGDVESVAARVDFGTVTAKDPSGRLITIVVDVSKLRGN